MQLTEQQQDKLSKVQLEESWKISLAPFLLSPQMDNLRDFLFQQKQKMSRGRNVQYVFLVRT